MALGKRGPHKRKGEREAPPKKRYFTDIISSNVKTVADRQRYADTAYHNKH